MRCPQPAERHATPGARACLPEELAGTEQMASDHVAHRPEAVETVLQDGQLPASDCLEHVEPGAVFLTETVALHPLQGPERRAVDGLAPAEPLRTRVGETIVEPLVPRQGGEEGLQAEEVLGPSHLMYRSG